MAGERERERQIKSKVGGVLREEISEVAYRKTLDYGRGL